MAYASSPGSPLLKSWGDEAIVYDTASGDTHYLKPLTLALYQTSREHPGYTSAELAVAVASRLSEANTSQFRELIDDTLDSLHKIGLLKSG